MNELTTTDTRVRKPGRDGALDAALDRLVPGRLPDRPDNPDGHVTAVRRMPPVPAEYAPFPAGLDDRLKGDPHPIHRLCEAAFECGPISQPLAFIAEHRES